MYIAYDNAFGQHKPIVFVKKRFVKILREKNRFFEVSVKTVFLFEFCFGVDIDK